MRPIQEKFKSVTSKSDQGAIITFTEETPIRLRGTARPSELTLSEITATGAWNQSLWDNLSDTLKPYWWLIRYGGPMDKLPSDAQTVGLVYEDSKFWLRYTDAQGAVHKEDFSKGTYSDVVSWKSSWQTGLPKNQITHLAAINAGSASAFCDAMRRGPLEICIVPLGSPGYDPSILHLTSVGRSLYRGMVSLLRSTTHVALIRTLEDLERMERRGLFDPRPEYCTLQIFEGGGIRLVGADGQYDPFPGFNRDYFKTVCKNTSRVRYLQLLTLRQETSVEDIIRELTDVSIVPNTDQVTDLDSEICGDSFDQFSWDDDLWSRVIRHEFGTAILYIRYGLGHGTKRLRLEDEGETMVLEGARTIRLRTKYFKVYMHHLQKIFAGEASNPEEALMLLATLNSRSLEGISGEDRVIVDRAAAALDGVEVVLDESTLLTHANQIRWERFQELFHDACGTFDLLAMDKFAAKIANGDQLTDIPYEIKRRPHWKNYIKTIRFDLSRRSVVFTHKDGRQKTLTHYQYKNNFNIEFDEVVQPQTTAQPQTQKKEEPQMAQNNTTDQTIVNLLNKARKDGRRMAVRTASRELVLTVRDPIAAALANALGPGDPDVQRKVALFMAGPLGKAIVGAAASAGLAAINGRFITKSNHMEIAEEVADELKIEAGAEVMGIFTGAVMGPVRELMVGTINSIAAGEEPQIPAPSEQPSAGLGAGSSEVIDTHAEEMIAEKVEVKKS